MREIETVAQVEELLASGQGFRQVVIQGLDLSPFTAELCAAPVVGSVFLGCRLEPAALRALVAAGALVFPELPALPYRPYRPGLYTCEELLEGFEPGVPGSFARDARDSAIYRHAHSFTERSVLPILEALAQRLHDHAIDDALQDLLRDPRHPRRVVAIMGGHSMGRDEPSFLAVARIARTLTRKGYFIASGGGPGAMEAANLGAWFSAYDDGALDGVVTRLAVAPGYRDEGYIERALEVRQEFPDGAESLAIPTWFYGHEPTNVFAPYIAKYFSNSLREDGLLAIAQDGVIYAPGSAGTIQEVFMDAAQNHYGTFRLVSPMVFFGRRYWTETKPVFPVLQSLAAGRQYGRLLVLADDVDGVVRGIVENPPEAFA